MAKFQIDLLPDCFCVAGSARHACVIFEPYSMHSSAITACGRALPNAVASAPPPALFIYSFACRMTAVARIERIASLFVDRATMSQRLENLRRRRIVQSHRR